MADAASTRAELARRFAEETDPIARRGAAPDCAERMAAINAGVRRRTRPPPCRGEGAEGPREARRGAVTGSPGNLSDEAIRDFDAIPARSVGRFDLAQAVVMRHHLMTSFTRIGEERAMGRAHPDLPFERPIRSVLVRLFLVFDDA